MENEKWKMKNGKFPGQLQSQTPTSAKPAHAQHRHTDDCHFAAAVFLQLAVGAGVVHRRLDPPIRGSCDRGESARLLQESGVPAGWTIVARQASRLGIWIKQSAKVTPSVSRPPINFDGRQDGPRFFADNHASDCPTTRPRCGWCCRDSRTWSSNRFQTPAR